MKQTLILASGSRYRQQLLSRLGHPFAVQSADIDEAAEPDEQPNALALRLARQKAEAIAGQCPEHSLIIGCDQVAVLRGQRLEKPGNFDVARAQLQACSGQQVHFYTALCLLNNGTGKRQQIVDSCLVKFRPLDEARIDRYLRVDQPFDCAGSFKMEALGIALFEYIRGDDPNSLVGLPLIQLVSFLNQEGVTIP